MNKSLYTFQVWIFFQSERGKPGFWTTICDIAVLKDHWAHKREGTIYGENLFHIEILIQP